MAGTPLASELPVKAEALDAPSLSYTDADLSAAGDFGVAASGLGTELRFLLAEAGVPVELQALLATLGISNVDVFATLADDQPAFRDFITTDLEVTTDGPDRRQNTARKLATAKLVSAW